MIKWIYGNTLPLVVELKEVIKTQEGTTTEDYIPPVGSEIEVWAIGEYKKKRFDYTIDGNVVQFTDDGTLNVGTYGIRITVLEPESRRLRSFKCDELQIVNCTEDLDLGEFIQEDAVYLDAMPFFWAKGDKGDPFTYDDFTPEQLAGLVGQGVPQGGEQGQILVKNSDADYDTIWLANATGVTSVNVKAGIVTLDAQDVQALPQDTPLFSGDYNDLANKPTIPIVPTNVSAFNNDAHYYPSPNGGIPKADLASDVRTSLGRADTALQNYTETDPTVPSWAKQPNKPSYTAQEVGALPNNTKYGSTVDLTMDSTTYVLTLSLKDQDGTVLNIKTVDLPIESVVVNGRYDATNKKIVLTLQSGSTIDVPVGDLVAGLQTEITSVNMLDADLIDDTNSAHKFVTAQEKQAWNNKSDFSGSYNDLLDKPTNVSEFTNDAGYLTQHQDISGKADKSEMSVVDGTGADADKTTITLKNGTSATVIKQHQDISGKQEALVSGTNIKTINNESILGSGNITIQGGGSVYVPTLNAAPTSSTTTYTKDGQTLPFEIGQFCRVPKTGGEYDFYQLYDLQTEDNVTATWKEVGELPSNVAYISSDSGEGIVPQDGIRAETVTSAAAMTINPDVVTVIDGVVGTAAITLQVPNDNLAHVWDILMTTDSTVAITFAMSNSATILYPNGFSVGASKAIEISVIGVGTKYYLRYGEFA